MHCKQDRKPLLKGPWEMAKGRLSDFWKRGLLAVNSHWCSMHGIPSVLHMGAACIRHVTAVSDSHVLIKQPPRSHQRLQQQALGPPDLPTNFLLQLNFCRTYVRCAYPLCSFPPCGS